MTQPVVVDLPASPYARGFAHGEGLRSLIEDALTRWKASLDGPADAWIRDFLAATSFVDAIEEHTPSLLDEVRGIADGSGQSFDDMLAFQLVDEQWCWSVRRRAEHEHCSTLGVAGSTPDRPTLVAQNLDLPEWWNGLQTVLRYPGSDVEPGCAIVTAAGFVVMNGMNDAGVAIGVNALPDVPSAPTGLPVAFVIRGALMRRTASEAAAFITSVAHASGQSYILGDRDGVIGIEADASGTTVFDPQDGCLVHTNHAVARTAGASWRGVAGGALANSTARLEFLAAHRRSISTVDDAIELLSDSSVPIRRVPTEASPSSTYATCVFELGPSPVAHIRGGTGETEFLRVDLIGVAEAAR